MMDPFRVNGIHFEPVVPPGGSVPSEGTHTTAETGAQPEGGWS